MTIRRNALLWVIIFLGTILLATCSSGSRPDPLAIVEGRTATIALSSAAFSNGSSIPVEHSCDGVDRSPPLKWGAAPNGTASLALVMEDPDLPSGTLDHWVLYAISPGTTSIPEGVDIGDTTVGGAKQGKNSFQRAGYSGPCPPRGSSHRFFFRLYALDNNPNSAPGASKSDLLAAMEGHILAIGQTMGTYGR